MTPDTIHTLRRWAAQYNTRDFIAKDPVQFPHRFTNKRDIEVSAFLTAWLSYGRREHILLKAEELHRLMGSEPYEFVCHARFMEIRHRASQAGSRNTFYRFYTYADLLALCERLHQIYTDYETMEAALQAMPPAPPLERLQLLFANLKGIPVVGGSSACKRLAMFLRWMVRRDGVVDFGIWRSISPAELIIPLDTHVFQLSCRLGLTRRSSATKQAAIEITEALAEAFPGDPCLGDFALFGYDIDPSVAK